MRPNGFLSVFLALSWVATPAMGQAPPAPPAPIVPQAVITAPATVPSGAPIVLYGDKSTSAGPLAWKVVSPKGASLIYDQGDRKAVLLVIPSPADGVYEFALAATGTAPGTFDYDIARVVVGGGSPPPLPTPTPGPSPAPPVPPAPPAPAPLPKGFILTLITDATALKPPLAALRDSLTLPGDPLPSAIAAMGGRGVAVDVNSAEYTRRNLAPYLAAKSDETGDPVAVPAVVIQDAKGKVLRRVAAPTDAASLIAYLKPLAGGN